jgi:putative transposase
MDGTPRKRMRRREVPGQTRFVTFSCQHRLPLFSNGRIARLLVEALARARMQGLLLFAWVIMPEHVHILCRPPRGVVLGQLLRCVKMSVSKQALTRWQELQAPILGRIVDATGHPRFWLKGGGFDRNVRDEAEFSRYVRYIHRNPVERGLVARPEEWRWSSVRWWIGERDGELACDPAPGRPGHWDQWTGFK